MQMQVTHSQQNLRSGRMDSDGRGDNPDGVDADLFPDNPEQWSDFDSDGYGDNSGVEGGDAFPTDPGHGRIAMQMVTETTLQMQMVTTFQMNQLNGKIAMAMDLEIIHWG